jgi:hypothetical protein
MGTGRRGHSIREIDSVELGGYMSSPIYAGCCPSVRYQVSKATRCSEWLSQSLYFLVLGLRRTKRVGIIRREFFVSRLVATAIAL